MERDLPRPVKQGADQGVPLEEIFDSGEINRLHFTEYLIEEGRLGEDDMAKDEQKDEVDTFLRQVILFERTGRR